MCCRKKLQLYEKLSQVSCRSYGQSHPQLRAQSLQLRFEDILLLHQLSVQLVAKALHGTGRVPLPREILYIPSHPWDVDQRRLQQLLEVLQMRIQSCDSSIQVDLPIPQNGVLNCSLVLSNRS